MYGTTKSFQITLGGCLELSMEKSLYAVGLIKSIASVAVFIISHSFILFLINLFSHRLTQSPVLDGM